MKKVSLIIVNWNGRELLVECLDSLNSQTFTDFSIIVVDNGSDDKSADFVENNYSHVDVIRLPQNVGFCIANNIAIRTVQSQYIALLNNDTIVDSRWLEYLVKALDSYPEAGFVASKMLFNDSRDVIDRAGDAYTHSGTGLLRGRGFNRNAFNKREWIFGACAGAALYRISMLNDIGLFDEDFFLLYEDVDLSFRAQLKGYKCLYVPEAIVYHKTSMTIRHDSSVSIYYGHRNLEWVYIQNMPSKLLLKTLFSHLIYIILSFSFFTCRGSLKEFIKAKRDAIRGFQKAINKRRLVQRNKRVDNQYIWEILEKEHFITRMTQRLRSIQSSKITSRSNEVKKNS